MDLSVIVVNYNTHLVTCNCIKSVYDSIKNIEYEIIVIDNNSTDQDPQVFKKIFPSIRLFPLKENVGFARANNIGMKEAAGKYFLLLNSDTIILNNSIEKCYHFMESADAKEKNIGVLGCKLLNADRSYQHSVFPYLKNSVWIYFKTFNPIAHWLSKLFKVDRHTSFDSNKTQFVGDVSGAFMFLRKEAAEKSGYFDEDFFMYSEDSEWCQDRLSKITNICYYPQASIIHLGGQSTQDPIMFIQAKLSLSLRWFKRGILPYCGYVLATYFSIFTMIAILPFAKKTTRVQICEIADAYWKLLPYIFIHIPRFKGNQKGTMLVYKEIRLYQN